MDCDVMPKMKVRKLVYDVGLDLAHMVSMVLLTLRIVSITVRRPALKSRLLVTASGEDDSRASRQATVPATKGPEFLTMSTWTRTNPASEEVGSRPCSKARMRRRLEY